MAAAYWRDLRHRFAGACVAWLLCTLGPRSLGAADLGWQTRTFPAARVLVLTHYDGEEAVMLALRAGVHGYLTKDASGPELVAAIRAVHAGERYVPPGVEQRLSTHLGMPSLTLREKQVLACVAEGLNNPQIAEKLSVTERTAGFHISGLLSKLGAKSRRRRWR